MSGILYIISAPSGSGKSTLVNEMRKFVPNLEFSISFTTRSPRGSEQNGREYYFITRPEFEEMLARDWNHPCIVIQTVMNESWGIDLKDATQRTWLKNTFNWIKECVRPLGRLVIDNSACEGNFHIKSDLEDFHNYYSMPDQVKKWDKFVSELAQRPKKPFASGWIEPEKRLRTIRITIIF